MGIKMYPFRGIGSWDDDIQGTRGHSMKAGLPEKEVKKCKGRQTAVMEGEGGRDGPRGRGLSP